MTLFRNGRTFSVMTSIKYEYNLKNFAEKIRWITNFILINITIKSQIWIEQKLNLLIIITYFKNII